MSVIDVLRDIGCLEGQWIIFPDNEQYKDVFASVIEDTWEALQVSESEIESDSD